MKFAPLALIASAVIIVWDWYLEQMERGLPDE